MSSDQGRNNPPIADATTTRNAKISEDPDGGELLGENGNVLPSWRSSGWVRRFVHCCRCCCCCCYCCVVVGVEERALSSRALQKGGDRNPADEHIRMDTLEVTRCAKEAASPEPRQLGPPRRFERGKGSSNVLPRASEPRQGTTTNIAFIQGVCVFVSLRLCRASVLRLNSQDSLPQATRFTPGEA